MFFQLFSPSTLSLPSPNYLFQVLTPFFFLETLLSSEKRPFRALFDLFFCNKIAAILKILRDDLLLKYAQKSAQCKTEELP